MTFKTTLAAACASSLITVHKKKVTELRYVNGDKEDEIIHFYFGTTRYLSANGSQEITIDNGGVAEVKFSHETTDVTFSILRPITASDVSDNQTLTRA